MQESSKKKLRQTQRLLLDHLASPSQPLPCPMISQIVQQISLFEGAGESKPIVVSKEETKVCARFARVSLANVCKRFEPEPCIHLFILSCSILLCLLVLPHTTKPGTSSSNWPMTLLKGLSELSESWQKMVEDGRSTPATVTNFGFEKSQNHTLLRGKMLAKLDLFSCRRQMLQHAHVDKRPKNHAPLRPWVRSPLTKDIPAPEWKITESRSHLNCIANA